MTYSTAKYLFAGGSEGGGATEEEERPGDARYDRPEWMRSCLVIVVKTSIMEE